MLECLVRSTISETQPHALHNLVSTTHVLEQGVASFAIVGDHFQLPVFRVPTFNGPINTVPFFHAIPREMHAEGSL